MVHYLHRSGRSSHCDYGKAVCVTVDIQKQEVLLTIMNRARTSSTVSFEISREVDSHTESPH